MLCSSCGLASLASPTKVIDSRESRLGVRRRRECLYCKTRFTTFEADLLVWEQVAQKRSVDPEVFEQAISAAVEVIKKHTSDQSIGRLISDTNRERQAMRDILKPFIGEQSPPENPSAPNGLLENASNTPPYEEGEVKLPDGTL